MKCALFTSLLDKKSKMKCALFTSLRDKKIREVSRVSRSEMKYALSTSLLEE